MPRQQSPLRNSWQAGIPAALLDRMHCSHLPRGATSPPRAPHHRPPSPPLPLCVHDERARESATLDPTAPRASPRNLGSIEKPNPQHKGWSSMRMYLCSQVGVYTHLLSCIMVFCVHFVMIRKPGIQVYCYLCILISLALLTAPAGWSSMCMYLCSQVDEWSAQLLPFPIYQSVCNPLGHSCKLQLLPGALIKGARRVSLRSLHIPWLRIGLCCVVWRLLG